MRDQVTMAIARTLGVSSDCLGAWTVQARMNGQAQLMSSGRPVGIQGTIENTLEVQILADRRILDRLQSGDFGSLITAAGSYPSRISHDPEYGEMLTSFQLLYGKETQHIFKALYQLMTVRGPQKRKKR